MKNDSFLRNLSNHIASFSNAVSTKEGEWIIKGFIDIYRNIYSISVDTKIISKVLELLLFPMLSEFANNHSYKLELSPQQNFYPDLTFIDEKDVKFALDIKSTYRTSQTEVNGMTLGAFTGYFRNRDSNKNTLYPYNEFNEHYVLGVLYSKCDQHIDEMKRYCLNDLNLIPSVISNFSFFVQPKFKIASTRPGSGNTKNIGSITNIDDLLNGKGPFSVFGKEIYDDYWMHYLTEDMARSINTSRPYSDLKSYIEYKKKGFKEIKKFEKESRSLDESLNKYIQNKK